MSNMTFTAQALPRRFHDMFPGGHWMMSGWKPIHLAASGTRMNRPLEPSQGGAEVVSVGSTGLALLVALRDQPML